MKKKKKKKKNCILYILFRFLKKLKIKKNKNTTFDYFFILIYLLLFLTLSYGSNIQFYWSTPLQIAINDVVTSDATFLVNGGDIIHITGTIKLSGAEPHYENCDLQNVAFYFSLIQIGLQFLIIQLLLHMIHVIYGLMLVLFINIMMER